MEREITQDVLQLKHRIFSELENIQEPYKTYRHTDGDFSVNEYLLNMCMQTAFNAGKTAGYFDGYIDGHTEGYCANY